MGKTHNTDPLWVRRLRSNTEYHDHSNNSCQLVDYLQNPQNSHWHTYRCHHDLNWRLIPQWFGDERRGLNIVVKQEVRASRMAERTKLLNVAKAWNMSSVDLDEDEYIVEPYNPRGSAAWNAY